MEANTSPMNNEEKGIKIIKRVGQKWACILAGKLYNDINKTQGRLLIIGCTAQRARLLSEAKVVLLISYIMWKIMDIEESESKALKII